MTRLTRTVAATAATALLLAAAPAPAGSETPPPPSWTAPASVGAPDAWTQGITGAGVGVALVDTGVSPRPELQAGVAGQVEIGGPGRLTDGHGHGTFLAGLIGGETVGVAPDAHVVSFKVADADGNTSLEQVVAALGAVRTMAPAMGLRVVVLALGGPADEVPDPLEEALEDLWASGLVVVVASGNDGDTVTEPGVSPYLLTVGATDDRGTADRSDDTIAAFSGRGEGRDGRPKPDVLAPGASVVSVRVPGSYADREHPGSRIDGQWFRGSGTSMSAAVAAGAAALLLQAEPSLTPDEVKGRLMASAGAGSDGPGLHVPTALRSDAVANRHLEPLEDDEPDQPDSSGTSVPVAVDINSAFVGRSWIDEDWVGRSWIGRSWIDQDFVGRSWIGRSWIGEDWVGRSWIGRSWIGRSWIQLEWDGRSWIGRSWIDHEWDGRSWIDDQWVGKSWQVGAWSADGHGPGSS